MLWYFFFFFISGFCGILYELIWLRLAMAQFGVTTAQVSIVLSMFMAGLGAGSLGAGFLLRRNADRITFPPLRLYALTELLIACSALAVPYEFALGHGLLSHLASGAAFSSVSYYAISGACVGLTLIPWCACMGATIPLAMFAIRRTPGLQSPRSFSFLYLSNVVGAAAGGVVPLFLIEARGFHSTLLVGAMFNCAIALAALGLSFVQPSLVQPSGVQPSGVQPSGGLAAAQERTTADPDQNRSALVLLFMTGLASMGMEVVWIRLFTPYIGVVVYSFATILVVYLVATFCGSAIYRRSSPGAKSGGPLLWSWLAVWAILPVLTADPRLDLSHNVRVILGIAGFSAAAGFLTPMLVDRWSGGDPDRAGHAYAVNIMGCILGPLLAGFLLLPWLGERTALLLFALPWLFVGASALLNQESRESRTRESKTRRQIPLAAGSGPHLRGDDAGDFCRYQRLRDRLSRPRRAA